MSVGAGIRAQRRALGLSLQDVEDRSGGRVKASVLGAYERDERAISTRRLEMIAAAFGVPVGAFLGSAGSGDAGVTVTVTFTVHGADERTVVDTVARVVCAAESCGLPLLVPVVETR